MTAIVPQILTLVGVVIGAVASYFATTSIERARWLRSQTARWDESRMRAYADYASAVKRWAYISCRVAAARGFDHSAVPLAPDEGLTALAEAEAERGAKWESILLLGAPATVDAARQWHYAVHRLDWFARGRLTDHSQWRPAVEEMDQRRDIFYECARKDLGITSGRLSPPTWPPSWVSAETPERRWDK